MNSQRDPTSATVHAGSSTLLPAQFSFFSQATFQSIIAYLTAAWERLQTATMPFAPVRNRCSVCSFPPEHTMHTSFYCSICCCYDALHRAYSPSMGAYSSPTHAPPSPEVEEQPPRGTRTHYAAPLPISPLVSAPFHPSPAHLTALMRTLATYVTRLSSPPAPQKLAHPAQTRTCPPRTALVSSNERPAIQRTIPRFSRRR